MTPFAATVEPEQRYVVLVGEPDEWVLRTVNSILAPNGFEILQARSGHEVMEQASALRPDVVLLSDALTDIPAEALMGRLRALPAYSYVTPVFITTTHSLGEQARIEYLRAGAWDVLRLPTNTEDLTLRLRRCAEAKTRADAVQGAGILDPRTGLYSLQGILRRAEEETTEARRHKRPLACVMLGPSRSVSSLLDRAAEGGSLRELERKVADYLRGSSRRSDILGRLTPSEFIVVAPDTDEGGMVTLAGRLLEGMEELTLSSGAREHRPIAMCAGLFSSAHAADPSIQAMDLLSRATLALRRSQSAAKGQEQRMVRWSLALNGLPDGSSTPHPHMN